MESSIIMWHFGSNLTSLPGNTTSRDSMWCLWFYLLVLSVKVVQSNKPTNPEVRMWRKVVPKGLYFRIILPPDTKVHTTATHVAVDPTSPSHPPRATIFCITTCSYLLKHQWALLFSQPLYTPLLIHEICIYPPQILDIDFLGFPSSRDHLCTGYQVKRVPQHRWACHRGQHVQRIWCQCDILFFTSESIVSDVGMVLGA